ncbi:UDP-glucosyltransferase 2-like [Daktulosphaira vitifoliae]|uniref:UDP-glucosyltransferase 2-like n=1 Tax=Daktulosphaira vitifoliae TaxID=58002 RepID=UPI0021A9AB3C|nr:UDP-glucosyltransferase 2-like [Daktulosphaira vitifoliae]
MMKVFFIFFIFIASLGIISGANILGVFPVNGMSHWIVYESILKTLAARGHNITVITSFPQKSPVPNYIDIDVSNILPHDVNSMNMDLVQNVISNVHLNQKFIAQHQLELCQGLIKNPHVQDLLQSDIKFDAVFTEIFGADCDVGFAYHFKAPLLSVMSSYPLPWSYNRIGGPDNPSYIPTIVTKAVGKMNFKQRVINTIYYIYFKIAWKIFSEWPADKFLKEIFGHNTPYINDIIYNTSMIFTNSHFSFDGARPLVPNMVEIGGIHIQPPKKIPRNILKFIEESPNGVMIFTFGSMVRVSTISKHILQIFKDVFSKLPIRVLWKYEKEMPDKPDNVFISPWLPQRDILSHSKVRIFMTHGGLIGTIEAIHSGVPVIGIPLFFDQLGNILKLVNQGSGILLDYESITKDSLYNAIMTMINNNSYFMNAQKLSQRYKDRPLNPTETVIYWTEYIIKHKGARHLQTAAIDMPWWKYFLIDTISFIVLFVCLVLYLIYVVLKSMYRFFTKKVILKNKINQN